MRTMPNFYEINKNFLLTFYNLPIAKTRIVCYNIVKKGRYGPMEV